MVFCQFHDVLRAAICEVYVLDAVIMTRVGMGVGDAVELELFGCLAVGDCDFAKRHYVSGAAQKYFGS